MPIAALFIIVTSWNELKCPTIKERIKKQVVINSYNRLPSNKEKETIYTNITVCNNNSDESQNYYAEGSKIVH